MKIFGSENDFSRKLYIIILNYIITMIFSPFGGGGGFELFFIFLTLSKVGRTPWTLDQPVVMSPLTLRTTQANIHSLSKSRTRNPSVSASEDN
jgi:hypothetical protein